MKKIIQFIKVYIQSFFIMLYSFTIGVFSSKNRFSLYKICYLFGINTGVHKPIIPVLNISDIASTSEKFEIIQAIQNNGDISIYEMIVINLLLKKYKPISLFEMGTYNGRTTINLAINSPHNARIYTIDLPYNQLDKVKLKLENSELEYIKKPSIGSCFINTKFKQKIIQLYGDTATFDFSPYYFKMDFIFIDASHSYEYIKNDTEIAYKLIKSNGILLWHDYGGWDGVTKALNEFYKCDPRFKNMIHIEQTSLVYQTISK